MEQRRNTEILEESDHLEDLVKEEDNIKMDLKVIQ
jgi:hypothetical protein